MTAKKKSAKTRTTKKKAATKHAKAAHAVGTVIERTFKGKRLKLTVTDDGYRIGRATHKSLTAAAKAVTGYPSVSGPRFWNVGND